MKMSVNVTIITCRIFYNLHQLCGWSFFSSLLTIYCDALLISSALQHAVTQYKQLIREVCRSAI